MTTKTTNLDILQLPKEKQITALNNKFRNLYRNPKFKALTPERQEQVKAKMYDRYLQPVLRNNGMVAPLKENWLKGTGDTQNFGGSDEQKKERLATFGVIGAEQLAKATLFGSKALHTTALFESHLPFLELFAPILKREGDALEWANSRVLSKTNAWKMDHYRELQEHKVASLAGESAGQLPLYMALGGLWSGVGISSQTLAKTPAGKFVAGKLIAAADGYMSSRILGESQKESLGNAARFAGSEALLQGGGKVLLRSGSAAKAYLGKLIALGGRKLVQESMANAVATPSTQASKDLIIDKLNRASQSIMETLAQEKFSKDFNSLSSHDKNEVVIAISRLTNQAEREVAIHGKDILKANIQQDLEKQPSIKAQVDPDNLLKQVVDKATVNAGMRNPVKIVDAIYQNDSGLTLSQKLHKFIELPQPELEKYFGGRKVLVASANPNKIWDTGTGEVIIYRKPDKFERAQLLGKASLKANLMDETLGLIARNPQLAEKVNQQAEQKIDSSRVVPGAANPKSLEFAINAANKYAPKIMMRLEGIKNKLLFAYSISNEADKKFLTHHLKDEFRDSAGKPESVAQINDRVKILYQHIQEMGLAGHLPPDDERGVFRSTRTTGDPSIWQQQLKDEVAAVGGKLKNYPSAKAALRVINKLIGEAN